MKWMNFRVALLLASAFCVLQGAAHAEQERRAAYLEELRAFLPESADWEAWLEESGELPPDFEAMRSRPRAPEPLQVSTGEGEEHLASVSAWEAHRDTVKREVQHWLVGTVPPRPDNLEAELLSERREEGVTVREVVLRMGPEHQAKLHFEMFVPDGEGPHPVFITQYNHRAWGLIAVRRGYLTIVYAGADVRDDTDTFIEPYADYDWSKLMRRGWAASRCIDYLETVPEADMERIALTGHSRNGKTSLMAAAMDERITAVISSSSGAGGSLSARLFSEQQFGEGIEIITRRFTDWFHPRLRFFVGREDRLPADFHDLIALTAPRDCLLSIALHDNVEDTWALEQSYHLNLPVYELYGAPENLQMLYRGGGHETSPVDIERFLDWTDNQFGRGDFPLPDRLIHPYDWAAWQERANDHLDPAKFPERGLERVTELASAEDLENLRAALAEAISTMLGEAPGAFGPQGTYGREPGHVAATIGRGSVPSGLERRGFVFGEYVNADVYLPEDTADDARLPAILWLPPANAARGYGAAYHRDTRPHLGLAQAGYAVLGFDPIGAGRRIYEVQGFDARYPHWSVFGKMLRDAQDALEVFLEQPYIDPERVYVVGYGPGALLGLHLAALDPRVAGVAAVAPPQPFILDTPERGTGGISRWSHERMWIPRLGHFIGEERRVPYDTSELMAAIAPRPLLVLNPALDWEVNAGDITATVDAVRQAYALLDAAEQVQQLSPRTYNHFARETQAPVIEWLDSLHEAEP